MYSPFDLFGGFLLSFLALDSIGSEARNVPAISNLCFLLIGFILYYFICCFCSRFE
uniref:Uncharacterized protein n=1 Tax=Rhizophora mucronata TaxID=61149 RepID=A0A2P2PWM8_RHIMU